MSCHHMKSRKIMARKLRCEHSNFRVNMLWMIHIFPTDFRIVSLICSWVTLSSATPGFLPSQELYLNLPWRRSARLWSTYYSCHKSTNYLICFVVIPPKTLQVAYIVWMILVPCSQYFFISIEGLVRQQYVMSLSWPLWLTILRSSRRTENAVYQQVSEPFPGLQAGSINLPLQAWKLRC